MSSQPPPSSTGKVDDMIRVRVKVGGYGIEENITVEVRLAEKVNTLRVKLEKIKREEDDMIRVIVGYAKDQDIPFQVRATEKVDTLRVKLDKLLKQCMIKDLPKYFFFNSGVGVLDENFSFTDQNIGDGDKIYVFSRQHLQSIRSKILQKKLSSPAVRNDKDDVKMRVIVTHGDVTTTEEVWSGQKVGRLKVKLGNKGFKLPSRYSFLHRGNILNQDLSFTDQNVGNGHHIEIIL